MRRIQVCDRCHYCKIYEVPDSCEPGNISKYKWRNNLCPKCVRSLLSRKAFEEFLKI